MRSATPAPRAMVTAPAPVLTRTIVEPTG
jgi:hypothetical protein